MNTGTDLSQMFGQKKPEETPAAQPTPDVAQSPVARPAAAASAANSLAAEYSSGVQQFALGAKIPEPTERIIGTKGIPVRVSPVIPQVWKINRHYDKLLKKSIECFGGECCRYCGAPKYGYIVPVVEYSTDREGTIVSDKFGVNYFRLGKQDYDSLCNLLKQIKDPTQVDFLATCTSTEYNTFDFVDIRDEVAAWRQYPEFEAKVVAKAKAVLGLMVPREILQLSREEYLELRAEAKGEAPPAQPASGTDLGQMLGK